jgi:hypothetical protein
MSGRDWQWPLEDGETLLWQGRPAPRCYTFRNWKQAAVGTFLFLASSFWMMLAWQLIKSDGYPWWLLLIPAPLVILSLLFGPVALLVARIRWEKVFYVLTDSRLLVRDGLFSTPLESYPLSAVKDWQQKRFSDQLISLRLQLVDRQPLILYCLEQPQNLLEHLQRLVKKPVTSRDSV